MATKPDVPRETVEKIAASYNDLARLHFQKQATQAKLIRACLQRIVREPGSFDQRETRLRIATERREAIIALGELADMLDPLEVMAP